MQIEWAQSEYVTQKLTLYFISIKILQPKTKTKPKGNKKGSHRRSPSGACCGGAADRVGTRFTRYGRAARRGRARASALEGAEIWISRSDRGSPCGRGRPRRAARPYRVNRVPTRSAAPPQHAPDTEKINPGRLVH